MELHDLEQVVLNGTFEEKGEALKEILEEQLYTGTFEEFCRSRFSFGDERARQLIRAADVVQNLKNGLFDIALLPASDTFFFVALSTPDSSAYRNQ